MHLSKVTTILIALLCFNFSIGQVYTFDKEVKFKFFTDEIRVNLFNSNDFSYHMQIYPQNDSIKARISDTKTNKVHNYFVDTSDSLKLKYLQTFDMHELSSDYSFGFSDLEMENDERNIIFEIFKKKKRRKAKYQLTVKETEQDYFQIFKLSTLENFIFTEIVPPFNFIVLKAKGRNTSGNWVEYELKSIEDINLTVNRKE